MTFNVLFMAHAPDADWQRHQSYIETGTYHLFSVLVRDQAEALSVAKAWVTKHNIQSILLCPGFTHTNVAEIFHSLGGKVGVAVARGDGPSSQVSTKARLAAINGGY
jgi:hypothetical protein